MLSCRGSAKLAPSAESRRDRLMYRPWASASTGIRRFGPSGVGVTESNGDSRGVAARES